MYRRTSKSISSNRLQNEIEIGQKKSKNHSSAVHIYTANDTRKSSKHWDASSPTTPNFLDNDGYDDIEQNLTIHSSTTLTPSTSAKHIIGYPADANFKKPIPSSKGQNYWAQATVVHAPKDYIVHSHKLSKKNTKQRLSGCIPKCTTRNDSCEPGSITPSLRSNYMLSQRNYTDNQNNSKRISIKHSYMNNWYNVQEMDRSVDSIGSCSLDVDAESTDFSGSVVNYALLFWNKTNAKSFFLPNFFLLFLLLETNK